jgi:hypothetical protein
MREGCSVDIGLALTYVTRDPQWLKKLLIAGAIVLVSVPFMILLVGFLGIFVVYGYAVATTRNVILGIENPLPEWTDFGAFLGSGFKAWIGTLVWSLPLIALSTCSQILTAVSDNGAIVSVFISVCLVLPISIIIYVFIFPTVIGRFAATEELGSMFQFSEVIEQIRSTGIAPYLLYLVLGIIAGFIATLGLIVCIIGVFFTMTWAILAQAHGIGQLYRIQQSQGGLAPATDHPAF